MISPPFSLKLIPTHFERNFCLIPHKNHSKPNWIMKNPKTIFLLFFLLFLISAHCQAQILEIGEPGLGDDGEEGGKDRKNNK